MNRISNVNMGSSPSATPMDKSKDWQLEILMEKLRSKASQFKSLAEISKNVRMTMLDKRYALDSVEKSQHQKCLDTLQHSIKVTSLQSMVERLESLTRQLGLKFMVGGPSDVQLFISSDMFYLEIILDQLGTVQDVKVHHEGKVEPQSCPELVSCLSRGDFQDFTAQLEGFASIYQLNAEKKIKSKAFTSLQSLESDLSTLAQLQLFMKEPFNLVYKSPVGILEKRKGGHPMKLTYFVSPYDLLDIEKNDLDSINVDLITSKSLGYSVTVCMEGSAAHKLQTTTLITVSRSINGKSTPSFSPLSGQNSSVIPATFVLKLNKPIPMCVSLVRQIQAITELDWADFTGTQPLLNLIVNQTSNGKLTSENNRGLFVTLPDQNHCYFMTENKSMDGVLVSSIPFTHPAKVSQILVMLRQQALFNTIIGSCVRPNSRQDFENMTMLEISALSWTHISISLEHPTEESMATAEIDLTENSKLTCKIHTPGTPPPPNTPDNASELTSKILNKCFSIPVTMRAIIRLWERQAAVRRNHFNGHENFSLPLDSCDPGGHKGTPGNSLAEFEGLDGKIKQENTGSTSSTTTMMHQHHQSAFLNETLLGNTNFPNFPSSDTVLSNLELTNILTGSISAGDKATKRHKRKIVDDLWKSSKRKAGDDNELLMETSSSDSTSRSTPLSQQEAEIPTPNSALGFQEDLELSGLDPAELLVGSDKNPEFDNIEELEELLPDPKEVRRKSRDQKSPNSVLMELGDKNLVSPTVSITPITTSSSVYGGNAEKRLGIDIVPTASSPSPTLPSSITITPISQSKTSDEKSRERKSSKSRSDDKNRLEKKRKRKRDESPMGPPEKLPPKQDPLLKPVTVSIKPSESPPLPLNTPSSPSVKYNASPTHNRTLSSGKLSPNLMKPTLKSGTSHHSPKHSPAHVTSSPKHQQQSSISSPKNHGMSPKHPSSGSGKPSMSTLKNAANSPSSKSESKNKSGSKESSRDKDRKMGAYGSNSKSKSSSSSKIKPLDLNMSPDLLLNTQDSLPSPSGTSDVKSNSNQVRNRKGMLSAIVDKLKSAQHCESDKIGAAGRERSSQLSKSSSDTKGGGKLGETTKNSEYMVKPSSDGIKLTINKTRTKESGKTASKSGSGSPKVHTGLKPGVNSGPASRKPQQVNQKSTSSNVSNSTTFMPIKSANKTLSPSSKSSAGGKSSKLTSSPKTNSELNRGRDRMKLNKSDKSIFSSKERGKSSPTQNRDDVDSLYKYNPPTLMMEGLTKHLDKSFQIPKLSARLSEDKKQANKISETMNNTNRSATESKIFEMMSKNDLKYPLLLANNKVMESIETKIKNNMNNLTNPISLSAKKDIDEDDKRREGKDDYKHSPISANPAKSSFHSSAASSEPLSLSTKSIDLTTKFIAPAVPRDDKKDGSKKSECDVLLDFTTSSNKSECVSKSNVSMPFPSSPSVSVHIVKSPAPSPLINPSPHAASPCITDDELMDEALIGLGK